MCEISTKHTIPSKISFSHPPYHLEIYKFSHPHLSSIYGQSHPKKLLTISKTLAFTLSHLQFP
ncbi:unnamed protein product, partial [Vitis vinifera]